MVSSTSIGSSGFVTDFTELKAGIKQWIDNNWDHGFLANSQDSELLNALNTLTRTKIFIFERQNPTAEVMAQSLFTEMKKLFGNLVSGVRMWESPNQYAEYREE